MWINLPSSLDTFRKQANRVKDFPRFCPQWDINLKKCFLPLFRNSNVHKYRRLSWTIICAYRKKMKAKRLLLFSYLALPTLLVATSAAEEIYRFFCKFDTTVTKINDWNRKGKKLKIVNLSRWSARKNACRGMRDSWHEVLINLEWIKGDCTEELVKRNEYSSI